MILAGLSDAQLKDIGIGRSEIPFAVWALEFERDRAQLRARYRAGEDRPNAAERASGERRAEDGSRAADVQANRKADIKVVREGSGLSFGWTETPVEPDGNAASGTPSGTRDLVHER